MLLRPLVSPRETFAIELEKPLTGGRAKRGRMDIWFRLTTDDGKDWRCAVELKFFKRGNQREPNNRYDVFKDIARLEQSNDVADVAYMLVATDHPHYVTHPTYSGDTEDFDLRHGKRYRGGTQLSYRTNIPYGPPITLAHDYTFEWNAGEDSLRFMLLEVTPDQSCEA